MSQPTSPLDQHHPDPIIQRLLDWLKTQVNSLFARLGIVEDNLSGLKIVRGIVDATSGTPSISEGAGFSITDNGVGQYTINFSPAFADIPSVSVTAHVGNGAVNVVNGKLTQNIAVSASAAALVTYRTDTGAVIDSSFHFIAIGPA